jgi:hypothetical protein
MQTLSRVLAFLSLAARGLLCLHPRPPLGPALWLPKVAHAFDLMLPRYSPAAQAELYQLERFLAVVAPG